MRENDLVRLVEVDDVFCWLKLICSGFLLVFLAYMMYYMYISMIIYSYYAGST